jgi:hypothetical protein
MNWEDGEREVLPARELLVSPPGCTAHSTRVACHNSSARQSHIGAANRNFTVQRHRETALWEKTYRGISVDYPLLLPPLHRSPCFIRSGFLQQRRMYDEVVMCGGTSDETGGRGAAAAARREAPSASYSS